MFQRFDKNLVVAAEGEERGIVLSIQVIRRVGAKSTYQFVR